MNIVLDYEKGYKMARIKADKAVVDSVREHLSVPNEAAAILRKKNVKFVQSRLYQITPTGRFRIGLFKEIVKYLKATYVCTITLTDEFKAVALPRLTVKEFVPPAAPLTLRGYQEEVVKAGLEYGRGIAIVGTGGGKTLIIATLVQNLIARGLKQILIIVPDLGLTNQTHSDFTSYKVDFTHSIWTGKNELDMSTQVIICNHGVLNARADKNDWINFVDAVIIDEVHTAKKNNNITDILNDIKTPFKFGFTGTLPSDMYQQWSIIGSIGSVIFQKTGAELREEKYLAPVKVSCIRIDYKTAYVSQYKEVIEFVERNEFRNKTIAKITSKLTKNALVLVDHIEHGELVTAAIKAAAPNKQVYFIQGEVEVEERARIIKLMEECNDVVVVAIAKIFSTGINVKNLHYLLFAAIGKSFIKVVQTIGRGVRLHESKERLVIFDIIDELPYLAKHFEERLEIYKNEDIECVETKLQEKVTNV